MDRNPPVMDRIGVAVGRIFSFNERNDVVAERKIAAGHGNDVIAGHVHAIVEHDHAPGERNDPIAQRNDPIAQTQRSHRGT